MKYLRRIIAVLIIPLLLGFSQGVSETYHHATDLIYTGASEYPLNIRIDSVSFSHLAQFDSARTESLNRLIKHFSMDITTDNYGSESVFYIGQESLFSLYQQENGESTVSVYSFAPDIAVEEMNRNTQATVFSHFLESRFFLLNRMLDHLFPMFEKIPTRFPDKAKTEKTSLNYTGYGKGVKKMTFQFSSDEVKTLFPGAFLELTDSDEAGSLLNSLVFDGPQKIILLMDSEDRLLRVNYDGKVGTSEESIRKLSVVCRSVREENVKKDKLTIKAPAIKGYDRDNIAYERIIDQTNTEKPVVYFDYQLDNRSGTDRKKVHFYSDLSLDADSSLSGKITYDEKGSDPARTIILHPDFHIQNNGEYSGILEITRKSGKIVTGGMSFQVCISRGNDIQHPDISETSVIHPENAEGSAAYEKIQETLSGILIRKILRLPKEDTDFLNHDIKDTDWNSLTEII